MATLSGFKRATQPGDVFLCVENTYRPELNGTTRTVVKAGSVVVTYAVDGESGFRSEWPKAVDVLAVSDVEITYRLGRGDHTVTLRRVVA